MTDTRDMVRLRDGRLENFAAELTHAVYPLVLGRGPKGLWVAVELGLWRALADSVRTWARRWQGAESADEVKAWREGLLVDLTEIAVYTAVRHGVEGPSLDLRSGLYQAIRQVTGSRLPVSASAETEDPQQSARSGVGTAGRGIRVG
jgi:hypothetical protein